MIKPLLLRIINRRHFWRYSSLSEIAELYESRTLRIIAMSIVSGFTSVYLYITGYSLVFIMLFWLCFYLIKIPTTFLAAFLLARVGPKHGILISNILCIPAMVSLSFVQSLGFYSVLLWGFFMILSASIYHICYVVDFSKIKNNEHAGKEIAFMNILDKLAIGIGPVIGGLIAYLFGFSAVTLVSAILFSISAIPLLKTIEPVRTHQKITFDGFPWKSTVKIFLSQAGLGFDYMVTGTVWSLFIVIAVFVQTGVDIYIKIGVLSSITILVTITISYVYGRVLDNGKGKTLLKFSVLLESLIHLFRPFVSNTLMIVGVNITNEVAYMGLSMASMRGVFDTADSSGHRILFLCISDIMANLGAALACALMAICATLLGDIEGMKVFFILSSLIVLVIGTANYSVYHK